MSNFINKLLGRRYISYHSVGNGNIAFGKLINGIACVWVIGSGRSSARLWINMSDTGIALTEDEAMGVLESMRC